MRGPLAVGIGSAVLGASGYVFLTLTAGAVSTADYAAIASLYLLVALVGPGLFMAVEQETTRLVSRWQALGHGPRDVVGQVARMTAGLLGVALVFLVAAEPLLVDRVFNGRISLWLALLASVIGCGGAYLLRGVLAGQRRLIAYGVVIGTDGLARIVPCLAFAIAGFASAAPYGVAWGFGSIASLAVALALVRVRGSGPVLSWRVLFTATGWLITAWGLSLAVANLAPIVVTGLMPDDPAQAGLFAFAFVLARVPLFVLYAVQPILLPMLSRAAANRDLTGLSRALRQAGLVVAALGAVALLTTAPVCLWLIGALFDHGVSLSGWVITLLAVGTVLAMLVQVVQPALLAVASHRAIAAAWFAGSVCFAVAFLLPVGPVAAAVTAQLVAIAVTLGVMVAALQLRLRGGAGGQAGSTELGSAAEPIRDVEELL